MATSHSTSSDAGRAGPDDTNHLFREFRRTGEVGIRNRLVERYRKVVAHIAIVLHSRLPAEVDPDDLISAGTFGLIHAIEKFDPDRDIKFSTYLTARVRGSMLDWLRRQDWVPRLVRHRSRRMQAAASAFRAEAGREPTPEEAAARLKLSPGQRRLTERDAVPVHVGSLAATVYDSDGRTLTELELLTDRREPDPASDPNHTALRDLLLTHFRVSDALLIRLSFVDGYPCGEIGAMLNGETEQYLCHRRRWILARLRKTYGETLYDMLGDGRAA